MKLHTLPKIVEKGSKRLGRGYGSGRGGHTSSRGTKGQKARGKVPAHFIGTSWVWFKRLPFIRGKSRFNAVKRAITVDLISLDKLSSGTVVNAASLYEAGIIRYGDQTGTKIKIVGSGKVTKKLTLEVTASKSAAKAIIEAGGEVRASNS